jgi:hypothetical protein
MGEADMRLTLIFLLALCITALAKPTGASDAATARSPILVELFTSEGCSDCPPADAFLQQLDNQPFPGAEMIVLSEHVDYWNHGGWKDPYSSAFFSQRQAVYASDFALPSVYTPEMVVDGSSEFVGSNQVAASKAFAKAVTATKIDVRLSAISIDPPNALRAHLQTGAISKNQKADVYVAIALNHAESHVSGGENTGRRLSHIAVARAVTRIGSLRENQPFTKDMQLKLPPETDPNNTRVVVFIQEPHQGRVLGATMQPLRP